MLFVKASQGNHSVIGMATEKSKQCYHSLYGSTEHNRFESLITYVCLFSLFPYISLKLSLQIPVMKQSFLLTRITAMETGVIIRQLTFSTILTEDTHNSPLGRGIDIMPVYVVYAVSCYIGSRYSDRWSYFYILSLYSLRPSDAHLIF